MDTNGHEIGQTQAALVRMWAKTQGIPLTRVGRIPDRVLVRYNLAHPEALQVPQTVEQPAAAEEVLIFEVNGQRYRLDNQILIGAFRTTIDPYLKAAELISADDQTSQAATAS